MGTHPIFESDFDCLTECCNVSPVILSANRFVTTPSQVLVTTTLVSPSTGLLFPRSRTLLLDRLLHHCHWLLVLQSLLRNCMEEERNVPCPIHQQGLQRHGLRKNCLGRSTLSKNHHRSSSP